MSRSRFAAILAAAVIFVSAGVFIQRAQSAFRAAAIGPGTTPTTGCEEESWLEIWRAAHHQPVYLDSSRPPFAMAYFNWLFYAGYAVPVRWAIARWDDSVLPRAGRIVTAVGAAAGALALYRLLRRTTAVPMLGAAAASAFLFGGPLVGWWAHSVRPDLWALAAEIGGVGWLLTRHRARPVSAALGAAAFFQVAWALKPIAVLGWLTAVTFLLIRREWRAAAILVGASAAGVSVTLIAEGPDFIHAMRSAGDSSVFDFVTGEVNLFDMLKKSVPFWLLAGFPLAGKDCRRPEGPARDALLFGAIGLAVGLPLAFIGACKAGAYSNYYFFPVAMLVLVAVVRSTLRAGDGDVLLAGTAALALQLMVISGRAGTADLVPPAQRDAVLWAAWRQEPEPRFSSKLSFNLPWLNSASPPSVLAYNYPRDRKAGRPFAEGGIGGMMARGAFASLLLPEETGATYDFGSLERYERTATIAGFAIYRVRPLPQR